MKTSAIILAGADMVPAIVAFKEAIAANAYAPGATDVMSQFEMVIWFNNLPQLEQWRFEHEQFAIQEHVANRKEWRQRFLMDAISYPFCSACGFATSAEELCADGTCVDCHELMKTHADTDWTAYHKELIGEQEFDADELPF